MKALLPLLLFALLASFGFGATFGRPNVVYVMADELGYFEPGFMGGRNIRTPHLDRMAAEGIRFNNLFAGSSVCAPTRCTFLTGKHSGHASVRQNGGGTPLRADEMTIASMLKPLGYACGGFGKWGCGGRDSTGVPEKHGFDIFLGYYDQVHAHSYYPPYLIRNSEELKLDGNKGGSDGQTYSHYVIHEAAMRFIRDNAAAATPFFAYLPYTPPHGLFDIPDTDPAWALYKDQPWSEPARRYAAMVSMVDRQVGELLALLKELNLDEKTLVFFSGDNGGADYFKSAEHPRGVHSANQHPETGTEYRGRKGNLYEGGLRIPFIARWPGRITPGRVTDHLGYFPDLLPTIAEVTGAKAPADVDGISLLPELIGEAAAGREQARHEYLYWEFAGWTAIRQGDWRAVKPPRQESWELYDLKSDPGESRNLAATQPDVVAALASLASRAHEPAREGTFARTDRHERDRRAKFGKQDDPEPDGKTARVHPMPTEGLISNADWKLLRASSENRGNQKFARNAIDGDPRTWWHTRFGANAAQPPHELVIDLGADHAIRGFVCLGRQDASWNGALKDVEFYVSSSADAFGDPVTRTTLAKSKEPLSVSCPETRGRYLMLRALSEHTDGTFASLSELGVMGIQTPAGHAGPAPASAPLTTAEAAAAQKAWGEFLKQPVRITNALGIGFSLIPPGQFTMGSPTDEEWHQEGETQHEVTLSQPFYMGLAEITQEQFQAVMGKNPSFFDGKSLPVDTVTWEEATEFCRKLSEKEEQTYRLPTEAEWEYACRAGTTTPFNTGPTIQPSQANYDGNRTYGDGQQGEFRETTTPAGTFPPNAWGLHDMHGNVWEWCQDWRGPYPAGPAQDPAGPREGNGRVVRGGCWINFPAVCRSANRGEIKPVSWNFHLGFRIVRSVD